ncbi:hypothetical protein EDC04DRAFT_2756361 [Pisolithus marmoratus]|nr:hypothetical protein EDC04DRAFT_2756361 [Pisolithus marmoratus]
MQENRPGCVDRIGRRHPMLLDASSIKRNIVLCCTCHVLGVLTNSPSHVRCHSTNTLSWGQTPCYRTHPCVVRVTVASGSRLNLPYKLLNTFSPLKEDRAEPPDLLSHWCTMYQGGSVTLVSNAASKPCDAMAISSTRLFGSHFPRNATLLDL